MYFIRAYYFFEFMSILSFKKVIDISRKYDYNGYINDISRKRGGDYNNKTT